MWFYAPKETFLAGVIVVIVASVPKRAIRAVAIAVVISSAVVAVPAARSPSSPIQRALASRP
jgi:hypothetical protein